MRVALACLALAFAGCGQKAQETQWEIVSCFTSPALVVRSELQLSLGEHDRYLYVIVRTPQRADELDLRDLHIAEDTGKRIGTWHGSITAKKGEREKDKWNIRDVVSGRVFMDERRAVLIYEKQDGWTSLEGLYLQGPKVRLALKRRPPQKVGTGT